MRCFGITGDRERIGDGGWREGVNFLRQRGGNLVNKHGENCWGRKFMFGKMNYEIVAAAAEI